MNDDLISRQSVLSKMKAMAAGCSKCNNYNFVRCRACIWNDAMNIVDEETPIHAEDYESKQGHWIEEKDRVNHWHCSECGFVEGIRYKIEDFCPKYGAYLGSGDNRESDNHI